MNKAVRVSVDMSQIELEEDKDGGLILACHRRASQLSGVSDFRDSVAQWLDGSRNTEPTRVGRFEDHYQIGKTLHQSEWTRIHLCHHKTTHQQRVVKVLRETCSYCHEWTILAKLDHPNLPVVHDLFKLDQTEHEFYMTLRHYQGGSLEDVLQHIRNSPAFGKDHLTEQQATHAIWQVLVAVCYLHSQNIVHCDLRPENILLCKPMDYEHLTVISFTSSFVKEAKKMNYIRGDYQGTEIVYLAPEVLQDLPSYDEKIDVWATGVILYRLLSNTLPFVHCHNDTEEQIRQRVLIGDLQFPEQHWKTISPAAQDFVRHLLEHDPDRRPSAEKILHHVWLSEMRKEIQQKCSPDRNTQCLAILGNVRKFPAIDPTDYNHKLVLRLRQAICVTMISRLLTNEQTLAMDEIFAALDTKHKGEIDRKQLAHGYYQAFSRMLPNDVLDEIWERLDMSKKGMLNYSEFKLATLGDKDWLTTGIIRESFEYFDKHNRGSITVLELSGVFSKARIKDEDLIHVMEMVDQSGSGFISFLDFKRMMKLEFLNNRRLMSRNYSSS